MPATAAQSLPAPLPNRRFLIYPRERLLAMYDYMKCMALNIPRQTLRLLHGYPQHNHVTQKNWSLRDPKDYFFEAIFSNHQIKKIIIHPEATDVPIDRESYHRLYVGLCNHSHLEAIEFYSPATELNYHRAKKIFPPLIKNQPCPRFNYL
jgi:hypothetical protein